MADVVSFPGIPAREDCASCPETGPRCPLHEGMYRRALERQETGATRPVDHQGGEDVQPSQPRLSKKEQKLQKWAARAEDKQFARALRDMSLRDVTKMHKQRQKREENPAIRQQNRMAKKRERELDPVRIAKQEAHSRRVAEDKARAAARRERFSAQLSAQRRNERAIARNQVKSGLREVMDEVREMQDRIANSGDFDVHDTRGDADHLIAVNGLPVGAGTDDFLERACFLIEDTLHNRTGLSVTNQKNLEEALSLVQTTLLLSSSRPSHSEQYGGATEESTILKNGSVELRARSFGQSAAHVQNDGGAEQDVKMEQDDEF